MDRTRRTVEKRRGTGRARGTVASSAPSRAGLAPGRSGAGKPERGLETLFVEAERIAHMGSYEWDVRTNSVYRSEELCRIFGVSLVEFKPTFEGYLERVHPEDRPQTRGIIENAFRERIPFEFEERIVLPDGTVRDLRSQGKWLLDKDKNPVKLIGICQDVTERKFAAGLLSAEMHVLECIAKRWPLPDILGEVCRRIEALNPPVMASVMLCDPDAKHLRPAAAPSLPVCWISAITPLEIGPSAGSCGTAAFTKGTVVADDIRHDPRWTAYPDVLKIALECGLRACWSTPIFSAKNKLLGTFALYYKEPGKPRPRDMDLIRQVTHLASIAIEHDGAITGLQRAHDQLEHELGQRCRAEAEVRVLNAELEDRVKARTRELAIANSELEAFASAVSHDLRAPLRRIDSFTRILSRFGPTDVCSRARECLDAISSESHQMGDLVSALLKLSRAAHGPLHKQKVELDHLASEIASDLQRQQPERSVEFRIAPGLVANGDPALLRAAMENLLDNAWKFTAKRKDAEIEFGLTDDGEHAYFVRDNGAGFESSRAAEVFAPFHRLHSAQEFPGTGIGLATVQQIISRHGGRIWANATPDKGATFFFTLP